MINTLCFTHKLILPQAFRLLNVANHAKSSIRNYSVRRCIFVVPACNRRKLNTALQVRVDCLNLSLFNDVQQDLKDLGRTTLKNLLNDKKVENDEMEWCVTVHPVQYQNDFLQDLDTIFDAKHLPSAISISHINNCKQVEWFIEKTWKKMMMREGQLKNHMKILLEITSPKGILRLPEICEKIKVMTESVSSPSSSLELSALIYGYNTLKKHLGTNKTPGGLECLYSRQKIVLIAKAFGLQAVDFPHSNPKAEKDLLNECEDGMILGFTGKMAIYPSQVGLVQTVFNPSRSRLQDARVIAQRYVTLDQSVKAENPDVPPELSMDPDELKVAQNIFETEEAASKYKTNKTGSQF